MNKEIKNIFETYSLISKNKKFISEVLVTPSEVNYSRLKFASRTKNEVAASSTELFGGDSVKIPKAGAHAGQSGWPSSNAWDIPAAIGTPVYAIATGTAITFTDYGTKIINTNGKRLYGQSFTVDSDGGLPDVYYTHLQGSPITKGKKIECGEFLGYVMDMPGSSYDHVHIGVESGHDIREFLNDDGSLKCSGSSGVTSKSSDTSDTSSDEAKPDTDTTIKLPDGVSIFDALGKIMTAGLTEEQERFKRLIK